MRRAGAARPVRASRRRGPALALAGAVALGLAGAAGAQTFSGAPIRSFVMPGAPAPERPPQPATERPPTPAAAERAAAPEPAEVTGSTTPAPGLGAAAVPKPPEVSRRLPVTVQGWIVEGENGVLEWPVYLTAGQAKDGAKFRLTFQTDISVAPEQSSVAVAVNGREVGRTSERAAQTARTVELDLPAGLLRPGYNAVRIAVEQRHRVDCSVAATYELWTRIFPASTGLVFAGSGPGLVTLADLPALPVRSDGALPIRVVTDGKLPPAALERAIRAAQAVALATRTQHPVVDFGPPATGADGVNLVVGREADVLRIVRDPSGAQTLGPGVSLLPAGENRPATLLVSGAADKDVDGAIAGLAAAGEGVGSERGLKLARTVSGLPVRGGETVKLGELGLATTEFSGRRLRVAFHLNMPADFFPADYGKIFVDLQGGYGPALDRGAHIAATVNGRDAANLPLEKRRGDVFRHGQIKLPLRMLQPGINRIEITADVPRASDATCGGAGEKRFLLLDESTVTIPSLARVGRAPELGLTAAGSLRFRRTGFRPHLVVPSPDGRSVAAAATIAARLAVAGGETLDFAFALKPPVDRRGGVLLVAAARSLDPRLLERVNLSPDDLRKAWQARAGAATDPLVTGSIAPPAVAKSKIAVESIGCRLPANPLRVPGLPSRAQALAAPAAPAGTPAPAPAPASAAVDPMESWKGTVLQGSSWSVNPDRLVEAAMRSLQGARLKIEAFGYALVVAAKPTPPVVADVTEDDVLLVAEGETEAGDALVLVTGPDPTALAAGVECLAGPEMWRHLAGRVSILQGPAPDLRVIVPETVEYTATRSFEIGNARLVAAGWLSSNLAALTGVALALAMALAGSTTWLVRNVGRRQA